MLTQKACFNSPVWFNVGVAEARAYGWYYDETMQEVRKLEKATKRPQCSACFIVSVQDSLESILDLAKTEGMLFKWGSGTGTNLSALREEDGVLSSGGRASGPLSFMKGSGPEARPPLESTPSSSRKAERLVPVPEPHLKSMPSVLARSRMDSSES